MLVYVTDPETKQLAQVVSRSQSDGFSWLAECRTEVLQPVRERTIRFARLYVN